MKKLIYLADPMCSWCYGFTSAIDQIKSNYDRDLQVEIIGGGYSPGNTRVMTDVYKSTLLRAWKKVQETTGVEFDFSMKFAGQDFCYDTEPSCRALVAVQRIRPELEWAFFKAMQSAFYQKNHDLTKDDVLADIAEENSIDRQNFTDCFHSTETIELTQQGFLTSRQMGISGFPTLVGKSEDKYHLITYGYKPLEKLKPEIDNWLKT